MGTYLQEAIEEYSRQYEIDKITFDVNSWRYLCDAFLEHIKELDFTDSSINDQDNYIIKSFDRVDNLCKALNNVVKFLKAIRPPREYYYGNCFETWPPPVFMEAIQDDRLKKYERMWMSQQ
jgi:hypothetical protein